MIADAQGRDRDVAIIAARAIGELDGALIEFRRLPRSDSAVFAHLRLQTSGSRRQAQGTDRHWTPYKLIPAAAT